MQIGGLELLDYGQIAPHPHAHRPDVFVSSLSRHVGAMIEHQRRDGVDRADSVDSMLATRDMEQVLAEILRDQYEQRYSEVYLPSGSMGVQPWADVVVQKRVTRSGLLDYVTSADMPWVQVRMQEITHQIRTLGGRFGWSYFEMQRAQFGGAPLRTELAVALQEAAADTKDMIAISGDAGLPNGAGFIPTGMINDVDIPITAPGTGSWAAQTAATIITDFAGLFATLRNQSRRTVQGVRVLVPETQYGKLETTPVTNTSVTLRTYLINNTAGLESIEPFPALAGAGVGGVDRAIFYPPTADVLELVTPMEFAFILEEAMKLRVDVYGIMRLIGLIVKQPYKMLYVDGV